MTQKFFFHDAFEKGWRVTQNGEDSEEKCPKKHRGDTWRVDKTWSGDAWRVDKNFTRAQLCPGCMGTFIMDQVSAGSLTCSVRALFFSCSSRTPFLSTTTWARSLAYSVANFWYLVLRSVLTSWDMAHHHHHHFWPLKQTNKSVYCETFFCLIIHVKISALKWFVFYLLCERQKRSVLNHRNGWQADTSSITKQNLYM